MNRSKTILETFPLGDQLVTTVHRIESDGTESADVLSVCDKLELELEDTAKARAVVPGERVYSWQR